VLRDSRRDRDESYSRLGTTLAPTPVSP